MSASNLRLWTEAEGLSMGLVSGMTDEGVAQGVFLGTWSAFGLPQPVRCLSGDAVEPCAERTAIACVDVHRCAAHPLFRRRATEMTAGFTGLAIVLLLSAGSPSFLRFGRVL